MEPVVPPPEGVAVTSALSHVIVGSDSAVRVTFPLIVVQWISCADAALGSANIAKLAAARASSMVF